MLVITNPVTRTVGVPLVQVQGYASKQLGSFTFDVSNATSVVTGQQGNIMSQDFDTNIWKFTTNYFQCFDITLTPGANIVSLHATDFAGNTTTTNLLLNLNLSTRTNPPVVQLTWPQDGFQITSDSFTLRGYVDDPTAAVTAQIVDTSGNTNVVNGEVERDGRFWADNLPLSGGGTNLLTLTLTDAAGNSSVTNIALLRGTLFFDMNPVTPDTQLWQPAVNLTGHISDATYAVWINGVKGKNNGDGTWSAARVPVSPGGVANFDMTAYGPTERQPDGTYGHP